MWNEEVELEVPDALPVQTLVLSVRDQGSANWYGARGADKQARCSRTPSPSHALLFTPLCSHHPSFEQLGVALLSWPTVQLQNFAPRELSLPLLDEAGTATGGTLHLRLVYANFDAWRRVT